MSGAAMQEVLLAAPRVVWYIGCLAVIGAAASQLLFDSRRGGGTTPRILPIGLIGAGTVLTGIALRLWAQTYAYFGEDEGVTPALLLEVATALPPWSHGWLLQAAAAVAAAAALLVARRSPGAGWPLTRLAAAALAATMPLTGHAVAQEAWPWVPLVLQGGHVLGAGVWLGGLLVVRAILSRPATPDPQTAAALVQRFSGAALTGAATVAASGALTAVLYLGVSADRWATPYGGALVAKIVAFAGVAAVGFLNWRWIRPRVAEHAGLELMRRTATLELLLAGLVLALTARLTGLPQP